MDHRTELLKDPKFALEAIKGEFIMDVTEDICYILKKDNLSRQELAERMHKTKSFVSQILNGTRNMTLGTLAEISNSLGYKPSIKFESESNLDIIALPRTTDEQENANFKFHFEAIEVQI